MKEGSSKEEEGSQVCSSKGGNKSTPSSDKEGIPLRPMEDSMDIEMVLYLYGGSLNTSHSKEKDLDERIYLRKKLISNLKEIKEISEANLRERE